MKEADDILTACVAANCWIIGLLHSFGLVTNSTICIWL
jgi:hypothetical protein